jgi:predicted RND superfamily exporter protein
VSAAILERPGVVILVVLAVTLGLGVAMTGIRFDNTPQTWLPTVGSDLEDYERFLERFGDDAPIFVWSSAAALDDPDWRGGFVTLAEELRDVEHVSGAETPASVAVGEETIPSPLSLHLESDDGQIAAIAIHPETGLDAAARTALVVDIEARLARFEERVAISPAPTSLPATSTSAPNAPSEGSLHSCSPRCVESSGWRRARCVPWAPCCSR